MIRGVEMNVVETICLTHFHKAIEVEMLARRGGDCDSSADT
jgi:hypothetical protein